VLWAAGKKKEASESLCRAVQINPNYPEAWNNLGSMWEEGGKRDEAMECWSKAIQIRPGYAEAHRNLAEALAKKGARSAAIKEWEEALRLRPDWQELKYFLAAVKASDGPAPTAPPAGYVAGLFDEYAEKFDQHLLEILEYRVPSLLLEAARRTGRDQFDVAIDLGCGTGLCGEKFRPMAGKLIGVDLSPKMITKSRERGIYDELMVGDLQEGLRGRSDVDLIVAGDVMLYVGELSGAFRAAAEALRQGGYLIFSVERTTEEEGEGFVLRRTRRFAHSRSYLEKLASGVGLEVAEMIDAVIRMEDKRPIDGIIAVLRKA
jgi:predicted TPR repeat methyltransferase